MIFTNDGALLIDTRLAREGARGVRRRRGRRVGGCAGRFGGRRVTGVRGRGLRRLGRCRGRRAGLLCALRGRR